MTTATPMTLSGAGRAALMREEGGSLHAYQDAGGVWTIGYGHTGPDVTAGSIWSHEQVEAAFDADTAHIGARVNLALTQPVMQSEFDALASLAYNIGASSFTNSSLVRLINARVAHSVAALHFLDWVYVGSTISKGLVQRRGREMMRFLGLA